VFVVQSWRTRKQPWTTDRAILLACWLGIAALIIWAAAFLNHTAIHPYFMARLLVIPVIGAVVLLVSLWIRQPRGAATTDHLSPAA
jgi:hypothetical protein